jgi:HD-like signal output (HDOD) protein
MRAALEKCPDEVGSRLDSTAVLLPAKPRLLVDIDTLMRAPDFEVSDLAAAISREPDVLSALFNLCRSPVYSRGSAPTDAAQALTTIGLSQTVNLVRGILVRQVTAESAPQMARLWSRCDGIAALASQIASERVAVCSVFPDQAYLAAMFHDCGVALLCTRFPEYWNRLGLDDESGWVDVALENSLYRLDHTTVGGWVARNWGLPALVVQAVRHHHEMPDDGTFGLRSTIGIVALATHIHLRNQGLGDPGWAVRGPAILAELGIHAGALAEYIDEINARHARFAM